MDRNFLNNLSEFLPFICYFHFLGPSHQANSINSLLSSKLPSSKSELDAASILANMNRMNQSPCSDEIESMTSSMDTENNNTFVKTQPKLEASEIVQPSGEEPSEEVTTVIVVNCFCCQ